jgi:two-component system, response regulator YesN
MRSPSLIGKLKARPEIVEQMHLFSRNSQIPLSLFDSKGKRIWQCDRGGERNLVCQLWRRSRNGARLCRVAHRRAVGETLRWGEVTIRTCCHSLMQITAPLLHDGKLAGYLVAAPFSLVAASQLRPDDLPFLRNRAGERSDPGRVLSSLTVVRDKDAEQAARSLFQLANALSTPDLSCLVELLKVQELQGKIADRIYDLKVLHKDFDPGSLTKLTFSEEKQLIAKIRLGDREGAKEILYRILAILLSLYIDNFELLKISVLEFLIILTRAAVEAGTRIDDVLGMKYRFITESAGIKHQEHLCLWVVQLIENLVDGVYRTRHARNYERLERALAFVDTHYDQSLSVEQVAREACLSTSRLSHIVKSELGITLVDYILKVRVDKAKILLADRELPISQVALATGFSDQSYFTRAFKKVEKCTPKAFRQNTPPTVLP